MTAFADLEADVLDPGARVICFSCGRRYVPSVDGTVQHTSHLDRPLPRRGLRRRPAPLAPQRETYLLGLLDRAQRERDVAVRAALAADHRHQSLRGRLTRLAAR